MRAVPDRNVCKFSPVYTGSEAGSFRFTPISLWQCTSIGLSEKRLCTRCSQKVPGILDGSVHPGQIVTVRKRRDEWQAGTVVSAPSHRTLRISLRATVGCSLLSKRASRGHVSQPWRASNRTRRPNSGGLQQKPSARASNSGRMDGARVCAQGPYCEGD
jgi:hypothetical protein